MAPEDRLVDKATEQATPRDGGRDISFSGALRKILEGRRRLGRWPQQGTYAA